MKNLIAVDLRDKLQSVQIPTLIVWGRKDAETPLSDAYVLHRGIEGSKLVIVDDARHSPHMTHPEEVVAQIVAFL
jgi:pimeloyl-ACP methyl ester carboxylesterase